jgi:hypothetical protein
MNYLNDRNVQLAVAGLVVIGGGVGLYFYLKEDDSGKMIKPESKETTLCSLGRDGTANGEPARLFSYEECTNVLGGKYDEANGGICYKTGFRGGSWSYDCRKK